MSKRLKEDVQLAQHCVLIGREVEVGKWKGERWRKKSCARLTAEGKGKGQNGNVGGPAKLCLSVKCQK